MIKNGQGNGTAPVLVLGVGNLLLSDDGVGLELLARLRARYAHEPRLEFVDGGTQGILLVPFVSGRRALLILDAVALGADAGTVHVLEDVPPHAGPRRDNVHEGSAADLLAAAELLGEYPDQVCIVGIEPAEMHTGMGLSQTVSRSLPQAVARAEHALHALLKSLERAAAHAPSRQSFRA